MKKSGWQLAVASLGLVTSSYIALKRSRRSNFRDCSVIISGGSRGLGLELARRFVAGGARVALLARKSDELERAREMLGSHEGILSVPCDVSSEDQVQVAVAQVIEIFGGVDVLVNCAGIIQAGPLESMTRNDFRDAMDVHLWAPLFLTRAVLPYLRKSSLPRIVNICSIGGKISVPHLLPYCASKFALAGLSEGLRSELDGEGIPVTTVYPGLMRTGSHVNAFFRGKQKLEYTWFSLGASVPVLSVDSREAADKIIEATRKGQATLIYPRVARAADLHKALFPNLTAFWLAMVHRVLPGSPLEKTGIRRGKDCQSWISPSPLTALADRAAVRNNEI